MNVLFLFGWLPLATCSFYVGVPMCLVSTFVVDALGFRLGMLLGTSLTFLGGLMRCLSTLPGLNDMMSLVGKIDEHSII